MALGKTALTDIPDAAAKFSDMPDTQKRALVTLLAVIAGVVMLIAAIALIFCAIYLAKKPPADESEETSHTLPPVRLPEYFTQTNMDEAYEKGYFSALKHRDNSIDALLLKNTPEPYFSDEQDSLIDKYPTLENCYATLKSNKSVSNARDMADEAERLADDEREKIEQAIDAANDARSKGHTELAKMYDEKAEKYQTESDEEDLIELARVCSIRMVLYAPSRESEYFYEGLRRVGTFTHRLAILHKNFKGEMLTAVLFYDKYCEWNKRVLKPYILLDLARAYAGLSGSYNAVEDEASSVACAKGAVRYYEEYQKVGVLGADDSGYLDRMRARTKAKS